MKIKGTGSQISVPYTPKLLDDLGGRVDAMEVRGVGDIVREMGGCLFRCECIGSIASMLGSPFQESAHDMCTFCYFRSFFSYLVESARPSLNVLNISNFLIGPVSLMLVCHLHY